MKCLTDLYEVCINLLKQNPSTFGDACMLAERIGGLDDFVCESGGSSKGYTPMDLDAANAHRRQLDYHTPYQQEKCLTCYYYGKKSHFACDCHLKAQKNHFSRPP